MEKKNKTLFEFLYIALTVALAFAAGLCFRQSAGVVTMFPVALAIAVISVFLPEPSLVLKAAIFGITVFILNTAEQKDLKITFTYTALCLLAVIAAGLGKKRLKKKKAQGIAIICAGALVFMVLSFFIIGNPIKAISSEKRLDAYADREYPAEGSVQGGRFETSRVYYNRKTGAYAIDVVNDRYPTESAALYTTGSVIYDAVKNNMEQHAAEPYVLEITRILREKFPKGKFEVSLDGFALFDGETIYTLSEEELAKRVIYKISISGIQLESEWKKSVSDYIDALDEANADYAHIVFRYGTGDYTRHEVVIRKNHLKNLPFFPSRLVLKGYSTQFNEFVEKVIER